MESSCVPGALYLVATPIGHLSELTPRAVSVLQQVDVVLCEDTRVSATLLKAYGIQVARQSFHQHNEHVKTPLIVKGLKSGKTFALISDAGMPLISDPGHGLVQACHTAGCPVIPISGACAVVSAVAASGLGANGFTFVGFLPSKRSARKQCLDILRTHTRAWVFFEAPHRMAAMIQDLVEVLPETHRVCVARELTKRHEEVVLLTVSQLADQVQAGAFQRGELVCVVEAAAPQAQPELSPQVAAVLEQMQRTVSTKDCVQWVSALTQLCKKDLYQHLLHLKR